MRLSALLAAVVLTATIGGAFAVVPTTVASAPSPQADAQPPALQPALEPDRSGPIGSLVGLESPPETEIRIVLDRDGNATWNVTVEYELEDEHETAAFDEFASDFEDGRTEGPIDADTFERFVSVADNSTDREMEMTAVRRASERTGSTGWIRLEFTWVNFLSSADNQLVLDDAFTTADGDPWLGSLEHHQRLVIVTPDGYQVNTTPGVNPDLRDGNAWIEGPQTFTADDRLIITYSSVDRTEPSPSSPSPPGSVLSGTWGVLGGAVLIGAAILAAALLYRRRSVDAHGSLAGGTPPAESGSDGRPGDGDPAPGSTPHDASEPGAEEPEDLSLLSDEERVERLLERNGGRMRQAAIVEETGWSDAKVSQLLSAMAEDGRVEKLRLGRENLISLPDEDDGAE